MDFLDGAKRNALGLIPSGHLERCGPLGPPDAIVVQLGENDPPGCTRVNLVIAVGLDLQTLNSSLSEAWLFWSKLL